MYLTQTYRSRKDFFATGDTWTEPQGHANISQHRRKEADFPVIKVHVEREAGPGIDGINMSWLF